MKRKVAVLPLAVVESPRVFGSNLNNQSWPAATTNLSSEDTSASRAIVPQSATPGPGPKTTAKREAKLRAAAITKPAGRSGRKSNK